MHNERCLFGKQAYCPCNICSLMKFDDQNRQLWGHPLWVPSCWAPTRGAPTVALPDLFDKFH
jgi:hypothetical protein